MSEALTPIQRAFTRKGIFWIVMLAGLVADIATKAWADKVVRPTEPEVTPFIGDWFAWKWAENEGAAFSILAGNTGLLALIAACVLGALFVYVYRTRPQRKVFLFALALVAAGAIGNLYDRLLLGHVRDFAYFNFDLPGHGTKILFFEIPRRWPVWNVADAWILFGVGMLLVMSFKKEPKKQAAPEPAKEPAKEAANAA
ncbi:MAG: signal peptidase II [Planctomycetes bacterium]|nr:signal peptidase II [Planctomycetota bacterium]MCW8137262.1 signal peptidase II [Planctomycetota bacterium]